MYAAGIPLKVTVMILTFCGRAASAWCLNSGIADALQLLLFNDVLGSEFLTDVGTGPQLAEVHCNTDTLYAPGFCIYRWQTCMNHANNGRSFLSMP